MLANPKDQEDQSGFQNFNLISELEKQISLLQGIKDDQIFSFCRKMFPVETSQNVYVSIYKTMLQYFTIKIHKGMTFENVAAEIVSLALSVNEEFSKSLSFFLKKQKVKGKYLHLLKKNNNGQNQKKNQNSNLLQSLELKYTGNNKMTRQILSKGFDSYAKKQAASTLEISQRYIQERNQVGNLLSKSKNLQICLVCEKQMNNHQPLFCCEDCKNRFHKKCQPRKNNCSFCQLRNMNPLHQVYKQVFLGFLRKGVKKHEIEFPVYESDVIVKNGSKRSFPSIEVRSIRMKDYFDQVSNYINLFPDACTIVLNNKLIKQFVPLHRQSSLKFRRDDAVKISNNLNIGINKLVITERFLKKDVKNDERVDVQNHLVAIYLVQQIKIPKQPNTMEKFLLHNPANAKNLMGEGVGTQSGDFMKDTELLTFEESQKMLQESLLINSSNQLSCDKIKVPLTCSLTLSLMDNPGRTIFCEHFSCFDIKNFFLVNFTAQIPRWQCPICKVPAYKFKIDSILKGIIEMVKGVQKEQFGRKNEESDAVEVVIEKDYSFKILNKESKMLNNYQSKYLHSIYDLPIQGMHKRFRLEEEIFAEPRQGRKLVHHNQMEKEEKEKIQKNQDNLEIQQKVRRLIEQKINNNKIKKGKQTENKADKKNFIIPKGCEVVDISD